MKTFGLFMLLWLVFLLVTFNLFQHAKTDELLKFTLATLITYIFYKLFKEEELN